MKIRNLGLLCLSAFLSNQVAFADNRPGAVTVSVADSYYHFATKRNMDNNSVPNVALAYNFDDHLAIEGGFGVVNTEFDSSYVVTRKKVHGFLYTLDGLYRFTPYQHFAPYISAGFGELNLKPNNYSSEHQANLNAGVGAQLFIDRSIAFRGEVRDLYTMSGGKNDVMLNFGMSFLFGG